MELVRYRMHRILEQVIVFSVAEGATCTPRRDTPKSARPCAGSGGDAPDKAGQALLSPHGPVEEYRSHPPSVVPFA